MSLPVGTYRIMNANDNTFLYVNPQSESVLSVDAKSLSSDQLPFLIWVVQKITVNNKTAWGLQHLRTQMWLYAESLSSWALVHATSSPADNAQFNLDSSNAFLGAFQIHPTVTENNILQLTADSSLKPPATRAWWDLAFPKSKTGTWYFLLILTGSAQGEVEGDIEVTVAGASSETSQA